MAEFKRRTLVLTSGKQIRMYGNSMAINKGLEIGEGSVPNLFSEKHEPTDKNSVNNPFQLSADDLMEIADYNMQLWMDLKNNIRKFGIADPKVFVSEGGNR